MNKQIFLKEWEKTRGLKDPERTEMRLKLIEAKDGKKN